MSEHPWIFAKANFDGLGFEICILPLIFAAAFLYVVVKNFRLTMAHERQKRGTLYWCAAGIAIIILLLFASEYFSLGIIRR